QLKPCDPGSFSLQDYAAGPGYLATPQRLLFQSGRDTVADLGELDARSAGSGVAVQPGMCSRASEGINVNWKSNYGVSDEGASAAGVFGTPNSTWDIARAQQATQDLDAARSQAAYPVGGATPSYTPTYSTPIFSSSASAGYYGPLPAATPIGKAFEWVGGMIAKIILASILIPVALLTVTLLVLGLTGFFTLPDTAGIDASAVRNLPISSSDYV